MILIVGLLIAPACVINKHIPENKILLVKNKVNLKPSELTRKKLNRYKIKNVVPHARYGPGRAYLNIYFKHSGPEDTTKWDKFILKKNSEKPIWYSPEAADQTKDDLIKHLNASGYYQGKVEYRVKQKNKRALVIYTVSPGIALRLRSIHYTSENKNIQRLIDSVKPYLSLQPGMVMDEQLLIPDQVKIIQMLQDKGYYLINKSNFEYYFTDSTRQSIDLECTILPTEGQGEFRSYKIKDIDVYSYDRLSATPSKKDTMIDDINYHLSSNLTVLKPKYLKRYIQFSKDSLYSLSALQKTRNIFQNLGVYRSVSVIPEVIDQDALKINLFLPPVKRQYVQIDLESSYVTNKDQVGSNKLFEVRVPTQYRHRNLFKGAEQFSISVIPNVGLQLVGGRLLIPWGLNVQSSLTIPRFLEIGLIRLAYKTRLVSDKFYHGIKNNARTRINVANAYELFYTSFDGPLELSVQREFKISFGYEYTKENRIFYRFNPVGFDYLNYDLSPGFIKIAEEILKKNFEDRLISGLLVKELAVDINYQYLNQNTSRVLASFESSGIEASLVDLFSKKRLLSKIARFTRFELDGRYTMHISSTNQFAIRVVSGVALPFGDSLSTIPFIRQFYVGGPNSIRGWAVREIGPGLVFKKVIEDKYTYFQTGNFKFEFGSEYRFDIFSVLKGAILFDGGNVWLLKKDPLLPGGELSLKFLSQLYLSTGFGIRLDFNYLLIRFDSGIRLRTPYLNDNGTHRPPLNGLKDLQFNLSLGYPF